MTDLKYKILRYAYSQPKHEVDTVTLIHAFNPDGVSSLDSTSALKELVEVGYFQHSCTSDTVYKLHSNGIRAMEEEERLLRQSEMLEKQRAERKAYEASCQRTEEAERKRDRHVARLAAWIGFFAAVFSSLITVLAEHYLPLLLKW